MLVVSCSGSTTNETAAPTSTTHAPPDTAPARSSTAEDRSGPDGRAATTTTAPATPGVELLPAGTTEVATVRPGLDHVTVAASAPPEWHLPNADVVRSTTPEPPRSGADLGRVALPSAAIPVNGRERVQDGWRFVNPTTYQPPQPLTFGVVERRGDWVQVQLPVRPNGTTGWVHTSQVTMRRTDVAVHVSLTERRLRVLDGGAEVLSAPVAIGRASSPTPTGRFTVTDLVPSSDPRGSYGPIALALDGHSEAMDAFPSENAVGAPDEVAPVLALHGTNRPASIGEAASNGCPRLANTEVLALARLAPAGTPVLIWP